MLLLNSAAGKAYTGYAGTRGDKPRDYTREFFPF